MLMIFLEFSLGFFGVASMNLDPEFDV